MQILSCSFYSLSPHASSVKSSSVRKTQVEYNDCRGLDNSCAVRHQARSARLFVCVLKLTSDSWVLLRAPLRPCTRSAGVRRGQRSQMSFCSGGDTPRRQINVSVPARSAGTRSLPPLQPAAAAHGNRRQSGTVARWGAGIRRGCSAVCRSWSSSGGCGVGSVKQV